MKFLLDTNICIYVINRHPPRVLERFGRHPLGALGISSITAAELADLRDKVAKEESVLRRLQERHAVYSGAADLFAKERKQLNAEIEGQETKLSELRSDLSQREMKQRVAVLQQQDKLRDLAGRQAKLEAEAVVFSMVTGTVIGMETEHGAESITVKLAVATTKEDTHGQRQHGTEDRKNR